jgi:hypothetical protein
VVPATNTRGPAGGPNFGPILDDGVESLEERRGLLVGQVDLHAASYRQNGAVEKKAKAKTIVIAEPPSIPMRAARHSFLRVGGRATCSMMTPRPLSTLAMPDRS